ncbi:MAG TPA: AtpZ/AtpI family protein [Candidatus Krumholzibacteria bacterium]|nr:AtpZ/AtpI family protein [Candidatus Krumholzibacteria bacterium]
MSREDFESSVGRKIARRLRVLREGRDSHWHWVGTFGLIGWSIVIPTVIGIALGGVADRAWDDDVSWTLTGLLVGLVLGCISAWYWIKQETGRK